MRPVICGPQGHGPLSIIDLATPTADRRACAVPRVYIGDLDQTRPRPTPLWQVGQHRGVLDGRANNTDCFTLVENWAGT